MTRLTQQEFDDIARRRKSAMRHLESDVIAVNGGRGKFKAGSESGKAVRRRPRHENGKMNTGESHYARHLDALLAAGKISGWWFEFMTFTLAELCRIQPDFTVLLPDGQIELHEIKGGKWVDCKDGREWTFFAEEDARVKMRMAGSVIPFPLYVIWPNNAKAIKKGGDPWCRQKINGEWWA